MIEHGRPSITMEISFIVA